MNSAGAGWQRGVGMNRQEVGLERHEGGAYWHEATWRSARSDQLTDYSQGLAWSRRGEGRPVHPDNFPACPARPSPDFSGQNSWYSSPCRLYASRTPPAQQGRGKVGAGQAVERHRGDAVLQGTAWKKAGRLGRRVVQHGARLCRRGGPSSGRPLDHEGAGCLAAGQVRTREEQHRLAVLQQPVHVEGGHGDRPKGGHERSEGGAAGARQDRHC